MKKSVSLTMEEWVEVMETLENRRRHRADVIRKKIQEQVK